MKAVWGEDYDWRKDEIYECPVCPKCGEAVGKINGKYRCFACGEKVELDEKMAVWFGEREETKTETKPCQCGGTMEIQYMRSPVTLEWQTVSGKCDKCGKRFFV